MPPVATCAGDLSADWVSQALGIDVRSVRAERIGAGQTSSTYRLTIDADECAPSLVAKLAEGEEAARRRVATGHRNEVGFYLHDELRARGVEGYRSQRCFEDYCAGHLHGPMITVIGCMTAAGRSDAGDDMFVAMARRSCAAIRDLKSLDRI